MYIYVYIYITYIYIYIYIYKYICLSMYTYTECKCLIYHETIGGLVRTERAHRQYINICLYSYIFVYM